MKRSTIFMIILSILGLLALFQLLLVFGLPLGRAALGGQNAVLPAGYRIASLGTIIIYGLMLWVASRRISTPENRGFRIAAWICFGYSCIAVVLNTITTSIIEHIWVPVSLVLAWGFFLLAREKKLKNE